jgi:hypothetical protein
MMLLERTGAFTLACVAVRWSWRLRWSSCCRSERLDWLAPTQLGCAPQIIQRKRCKCFGHGRLGTLVISAGVTDVTRPSRRPPHSVAPKWG